MNCDCSMKQTDKGPNPYVADVQQMAVQNDNFRTTIWTGCYMQMTLMSIPQCGEVGLEIHPETDQLLRVEQGTAVVKMGKCKNQQDLQQNVCAGDCIFVPMGTWHNIINTGKCPLKISSVYAPPHHPKGTINKTKADAD